MILIPAAVIAVLIKLESSGPVIYSQNRIGKDHRVYKIYKFRTMVHGAEEFLTELLSQDEELLREYNHYHKLKDDPRITRIGAFLRRYSLDELPQIINILKGEMSLIGPRAYLPSELEHINGYLNIILKVRPGITGWWQVNGRNRTSFSERIQMDYYYLSNWSLWLDFYIFFKTFFTLIHGDGR